MTRALSPLSSLLLSFSRRYSQNPFLSFSLWRSHPTIMLGRWGEEGKGKEINNSLFLWMPNGGFCSSVKVFFYTTLFYIFLLGEVKHHEITFAVLIGAPAYPWTNCTLWIGARCHQQKGLLPYHGQEWVFKLLGHPPPLPSSGATLWLFFFCSPRLRKSLAGSRFATERELVRAVMGLPWKARKEWPLQKNPKDSPKLTCFWEHRVINKLFQEEWLLHRFFYVPAKLFFFFFFTNFQFCPTPNFIARKEREREGEKESLQAKKSGKKKNCDW